MIPQRIYYVPYPLYMWKQTNSILPVLPEILWGKFLWIAGHNPRNWLISAVEKKGTYIEIVPFISVAYTCLDGTTYLVYSKKNSFYCSSRLYSIKRISEQQLADMCTEDPRCSGYDYRGSFSYGYLCKQDAYPGSSKTCCGYKLCKKSGMIHFFETKLNGQIIFSISSTSTKY